MGTVTTWADNGAMAGGGVKSTQIANAPSSLVPGSLAPAFSLPDADMEMFDLSLALKSWIVVLHFYPRDAMSSSLRHALAFSERDEDFARCGACVVGVSLDDCLTHADFRDHNGLTMRLLSDPDAEVCRLYGTWQDPHANGAVRPAVHRTTFVIGRDGTVLHIDRAVDLKGHASKILESLKPLSGRKNGNHQEHRRYARLHRA